MRRAGITDVAALARVSIKTVSRVTNGETSVRPDTRERVLEAIAQLNYVPNSAARSLKSGTGNTIGVVIDSLADPFFAALVSAIEARAVAEGLSILVASTGIDERRERDQITSLVMGHRVSGLILVPVAPQHAYLDAYQRTHPVIAVDRERPYFDSVIVDDFDATKNAVLRLVENGHRRIAFFDDDERFSTVTRRLAGYRAALSAAGIAESPELIGETNPEAPDYAAEAAQLLALPDPPTAFFASNLRSGVGLARALHQSERTDVAMISFGDFSLADALNPPVSYIDQDPLRIGNTAIEMLLERRGQRPAEREERVITTTLVQRGSCSVPPPATTTARKDSDAASLARA